MKSLNINIKKICDNIEITRQSISKYQENLWYLTTELKKVDNSWRDGYTNKFIKSVNTDYSLFLEHSKLLEKILNYYEIFIEEISRLVKNNLDIYDIKRLSFNYDNMGKIINSLDKVYLFLQNIISILDNIIIPQDFIYKDYIKNMSGNCLVFKNDINNLKLKLININENCLKICNKYEEKILQIENIEIDDKLFECNYVINDFKKVTSFLDELDFINRELMK